MTTLALLAIAAPMVLELQIDDFKMRRKVRQIRDAYVSVRKLPAASPKEDWCLVTGTRLFAQCGFEAEEYCRVAIREWTPYARSYCDPKEVYLREQGLKASQPTAMPF